MFRFPIHSLREILQVGCQQSVFDTDLIENKTIVKKSKFVYHIGKVARSPSRRSTPLFTHHESSGLNPYRNMNVQMFVISRFKDIVNFLFNIC